MLDLLKLVFFIVQTNTIKSGRFENWIGHIVVVNVCG